MLYNRSGRWDVEFTDVLMFSVRCGVSFLCVHNVRQATVLQKEPSMFYPMVHRKYNFWLLVLLVLLDFAVFGPRQNLAPSLSRSAGETEACGLILSKQFLTAIKTPHCRLKPDEQASASTALYTLNLVRLMSISESVSLH